MKSLIQPYSMIIIAFWLICPKIALGQENTIVLGRIDKWFNLEMVFRIEVLDQDSHMPIKNAIVSLEADRTITSRTDRNGICVILFFNPRNLWYKLKVSASNYKYWEEEFTYGEYKSELHDHRMFIHGMSGDWSGDRPSLEQTINAIRYKNYRIISDINIFGQAPGIFEKIIILEYLNRNTGSTTKSNSKVRSKDRSKSTSGYTQQRNRENSQNKEVYFSESYYHNTEWVLKVPSENIILYIKFQPGKLSYKDDPYLPYNTVDINWWIESNQLYIHLKPNLILSYEIEPSKTTYNGQDKYTQKSTTIRRH